MLRLVATSTAASRFFSTVSGRSKLIGAINSEIKAIELDVMKKRAVPADLPFTIEDEDKYCHIMLKRDLGPERIEVTVNPIHDIPKKTDDDKKSEVGKFVRINVSISKEDKGTFDVGANVSGDEICVDKLSFCEANSYDPSIRLDGAKGELKDALSDFVKARGIEISSVGFLYNYMVEKRKRWDTIWVPTNKPQAGHLKNLNKFVENW
ncbi:uncharacterized protein LOC125220650 [Salvia hispanica]|uniref:uncharacterized protein LOC125220650 n=1 Tax=Salvia hispanica TaxID=49212 RepID=UPI00200919B7|nr:uncharacterized protein LOC125220650 [Salvia hispanica]